MSHLNVSHPSGVVSGAVKAPASKSISNRALIIQSLCSDKPLIENLSGSDDTWTLQSALEIMMQNRGSSTPVTIDIDNAGTAMRFLAARLAIEPGKWLLTGSARMLERPIAELVDALKKLGGSVGYAGKEGYPPLLIHGKWPKGSKTTVRGSISSQFISGLLMIAPALPEGIKLTIEGTPASVPYIYMTLRMMAAFGVQTARDGNVLMVPPQSYSPENYAVEVDWSAASYWFETAALAKKGEILVNGLRPSSLQGDAAVAGIFKNLGVSARRSEEGMVLTKTGTCDTSIPGLDLRNTPDLAQTVIVTAAGLNLPGIFTGLDNLRFKETDRLSALVSELRKLGIRIEGEGGTRIRLHDREWQERLFSTTPVQTFGDHRMAMAFAPMALKCDEIIIEDPEVTSKSYPEFWEELRKTGFHLRRK